MQVTQFRDEDGRSLADCTPIAQVMSRDVVCVTEDLSVEELTHMFMDRGFSGAPVTDATGRIVGVVSKTDVVRQWYEHPDGPEHETTPLRMYDKEGRSYDLGGGFHAIATNAESVADIMTPVAYTLKVSTSISQAAALMAFEGIHRIPVVSDEGVRVVGLLSALDVLRWIGEQDGYLRRHHDSEIAQG